MKPADIRAALARPFRVNGRLDWGILLAFLAINGLVLVNAVLHHPEVGYDAREHLVNIDVLSQLRLVTPKDTEAFYYSPIPYALPALFKYVTGAELHTAAKFAQGINVLLSLGLTFFLLRACQLIGPAPILRLGTLLALGVVPAYYKTFAYVRGEPYVAFFSTLALYLIVRVFIRRRTTTWGAVALGLALGMAPLSRQWGVFLLPAAGLMGLLHWLRHKQWRWAIARTLLLSLTIATFVGGSFYALQRVRFGSMATFNRRGAPCFSLSNQPPEFYLGLGLDTLFDEPIRPNFPNEFLPTFYSELWGDYWGHFLIYGIDVRSREYVPVRYLPRRLATGDLPEWMVSNFQTVGAELGRVNLVSLLPSALALIALLVAAASLVLFRSEPRRRELAAFALPAILLSFGGYLWFMVMFPSLGRGDTIKASYMLHTFPLVAILVGVLLDRIRRSLPLVARFLVLLLVLCALHNTTAMVTRCTTAQLQAVEGG